MIKWFPVQLRKLLLFVSQYNTKMKDKQALVIVLPEHLEGLPVKVVRGGGFKHLVLCVEQEENIFFSGAHERRYAFIWHQDDYLKVALDEILWIEAAGSYSIFHLTGEKTIMISFHLAVVERKLPQTEFMRIHRSYIVNLQYVVSLIGNSLKVGKRLLVIGRGYRERLSEHFIFLGVRRDGKH